MASDKGLEQSEMEKLQDENKKLREMLAVSNRCVQDLFFTNCKKLFEDGMETIASILNTATPKNLPEFAVMCEELADKDLPYFDLIEKNIDKFLIQKLPTDDYFRTSDVKINEERYRKYEKSAVAWHILYNLLDDYLTGELKISPNFTEKAKQLLLIAEKELEKYDQQEHFHSLVYGDRWKQVEDFAKQEIKGCSYIDNSQGHRVCNSKEGLDNQRCNLHRDK